MIELLTSLPDLVLHLDQYLPQIIEVYGALTYLLLFIIIFCETGLVLTPYLPGDSLIFFAGTLAGTGILDVWLLSAVLCSAAILGDTVNYWVGQSFGERIIRDPRKIIREEHVRSAEGFFRKYGGKTIVLARFVPFVRTFAPFLAGMGKMPYRTFITYNMAGGILWVMAFVSAGYLFGNIPFIRDHMGITILLIIGISLLALLPLVRNYVRDHRSSAHGQDSDGPEILQ